jgi:putative Holliday junction resolvase
MLGVDYGVRRVGIALSDPTGTLASPLTTLRRRRGKRPPVAAVAELAETHEVAGIVIGLPLTLQGDEDDWCAEVRHFGDSLATRTGLPVTLVDERFTSVQAERAVRSSGLPRSDREDKARIDSGAAAVILQSWIDGAPAR